MIIPAITDIDNITRIWKSTLEQQLELDSNLVRSLVSSKGQMLNKKISEYVYDTLSREDVCVLFEIDLDNSKNSVSMELDYDTVLSYIYGKIKVIIYGRASELLSIKLKARLESSEVRGALWNSGINLDEISSIESVHEFINEVIYFRTDINIKFSFRYDTSKLIHNELFEYENPTPDTISTGLTIKKI